MLRKARWAIMWDHLGMHHGRDFRRCRQVLADCVHLHLLPGRPLPGSSSLPHYDRRWRPALTTPGGTASGVHLLSGAVLVCAHWQSGFQSLWNHAAGVQDCRRDHSAAHGIDMLQARRSPPDEVAGEPQEASEKEDVSVIPLGIPMLAGPGSISTVMVLMGETGHWWHTIPVFAAIAITSMASYAVLAGVDRSRAQVPPHRHSHHDAIHGTAPHGCGVQFILNGFTDVGLIHPG